MHVTFGPQVPSATRQGRFQIDTQVFIWQPNDYFTPTSGNRGVIAWKAISIAFCSWKARGSSMRSWFHPGRVQNNTRRCSLAAKHTFPALSRSLHTWHYQHCKLSRASQSTRSCRVSLLHRRVRLNVNPESSFLATGHRDGTTTPRGCGAFNPGMIYRACQELLHVRWAGTLAQWRSASMLGCHWRTCIFASPGSTFEADSILLGK